MATTTATRRLAAILAADVVGYSRLMGADEEGTRERFKAHLREAVDSKSREHHGRIVKTTGDGVLAEFAIAHFAKGHVLRAQNRWEEAIPEYEAALTLNHNFVGALMNLGWGKLYAGSIEEVTPLVEQAIRLSPRDPVIGYCSFLIGTVHRLQWYTDEAIAWLEEARGAGPSAP